MSNSPNSGFRGNEPRPGNIQNAAGGVPGAAGSPADKARDMARGAVESARDTATGVMDRARDVAGTVADKARDAAGNVADTARDWASGAVNAVKDSGVVNKAEEYVSEAWETGSRYVHEHNIKDMADDVAGVIRRNPIPALLIGVGVGFLLGRSLRS